MYIGTYSYVRNISTQLASNVSNVIYKHLHYAVSHMSKCMLFCRYSYTVDGVSEPMLHSEIFIIL